MKIKYSQRINNKDILDILKIVKAVSVFNKGEVGIAKELLLDSKKPYSKRYYRFVTAKIGGKMAGYACYAKIDGTDGRYEMYWLAVSPEFQRNGIARGIIGEVERIVRQQKGKKIVIVTSSKPDYLPARTSYERSGYVCAAILKDYYCDGDDEVFYEKRITE